MKVLHFFKTYWPDTYGGVERTIHSISKGTAAYGVEAQVLSLSRKPDKNSIIFDGHPAHKAHLDIELASTGFSLSAFRRFQDIGSEVDVIHFHYPWPFMDIVHFAIGLGKPTLVTYHSDIVKQRILFPLYQPLMRRFLGTVDRIVATSPNYVASSHQLRPFSDKVQIIPIGLDRNSYPAVEQETLAHWRKKLPGRFFLFVGVLRYYKGLHLLIAAMQKARYPVVIVGTGPMEEELKSQARLLGLDSVYFLGNLPDKDKVALLDLCYALVFTSHLRSEAFGLSLVEASMFGKPMISCEIGTGTSYVNLNGKTGIVIPPNDPDEIANAMTRLWLAPETASKYGEAARLRYLENFTADRMASAYAKLYNELAANRNLKSGTLRELRFSQAYVGRSLHYRLKPDGIRLK